MPQLDPSTYPSQVFWLALTFVALYLILWRIALPRISNVLAARREHIDGDLEKAASFKQSAEKALAEYEKAIAEARSRAQTLMRETEEEASDKASKEHEALGARISQQVEEAEARIAKAKQDAVANLRAVAVEVVDAAARRLVGLTVGVEDRERAVDAVVREKG